MESIQDSPTDFDYFSGKKPERTYISKRLFNSGISGSKKAVRIVSKVLDGEMITHAVLKDEVVLKAGPKMRQCITAKVYEDKKKVFCLIIQKFDILNGQPHETSFSFRFFEFQRLKEFLDSIQLLDFESSEKSRVEDDELKKIREFLSKNPDADFIVEYAQKNITKSDIVALGYRKEQLEVFRNLLNDENFFDTKKAEWEKSRDEDVWQHFFEKNPWIFGYGLNYIFNIPLEGRKLEQTVSGADFNEAGKRADGLLKSSGLINSICLIEIKTSKTPLIKNILKPYREESWQVSDELSGGVAQSHKTVEKTIKNIEGARIRIKTKTGEPTGEVVYSYEPKSYLIIGKLSEFIMENGINEDKLGSFEHFRRNIKSPEIITFDELFSRAKFIVHNSEEASQKS